METETNKFLEYQAGRNVFAFHCPICDTRGELAVSTGRNRNALVACPSVGCGAFFIVRYNDKSLVAKPELQFAFGPRRKPAKPEVQGKKKKRAS